jgi:hypothetical protein
MGWTVRKHLGKHLVEDTLTALRVRGGDMIRLSRRAEHPAVAKELEHLARQYLDLACSLEEDRRHRPANDPPKGARPRPCRKEPPSDP